MDLPRKALNRKDQARARVKGHHMAPASIAMARAASRCHVPDNSAQVRTSLAAESIPLPWTTVTAQRRTITAISKGKGRDAVALAMSFGKQFLPVDPGTAARYRSRQVRRASIAFVDDLFFLTKIQETGRKLNVKVEFVKTDKELYERIGQNGDDKPSLIIFDLNNLGAKPLTLIPKLKSKLKKATNIIGFVSHVRASLKMKAQEAGCDMVLPRSAFSQNLPQLLRRHGAPEEVQEPERLGIGFEGGAACSCAIRPVICVIPNAL